MKLPKHKQAWHNFSARQRQTGVAVKFKFGEWWAWWQATGRWDQRGVGNDRYCMTRIDREGEWTLDNIQCVTGLENRRLHRRKKKNGNTTTTTVQSV